MWVGGAEEAEQWSVSLLKHHPGSDAALRKNLERLVAAGRFAEALDEMERLQVTDRTRWRAAEIRARACLGAQQAECARQQGRIWQQELLKARERGGGRPEWDVLPLMVEVLTEELAGSGADLSANLTAVQQLIEQHAWFDTKFYLKAGVAARRQDFDQAFTLLERSLQEASPGIFGLDILGMSAEHSLLLSPLRNRPEFQEWLVRHLEQRDAALAHMRQLEARGEIIKASAADRLSGD